MLTVVLFVELVATSIWVGGLVAISVVARVARSELGQAVRIAFFRRLGHDYLVVGGGALAVALVCGAILLASGDWTSAKTAAVALGAALAGATVLAVGQARAMTRLRARSLREPGDVAVAKVRAAAMRATVLRAVLGVLTIVLLAVASAIAL